MANDQGLETSLNVKLPPERKAELKREAQLDK
jgi:hypothetical protein